MAVTVQQPSDTRTILPGATVGVLGSGQLGRMFAQAAARLGYRVHVFSPAANSPTGQVADQETVADYDDLKAVERFAKTVDVVTLEFENVPTTATNAVARHCPVRPSCQVLHVTQDRLREKNFLQSAGIPCTPFAEVTSEAQLIEAVDRIGAPAVLKTTAAGYDGKGQAKVDTTAAAAAAWQSIGRLPAILEGWVDYEREFSVLVARSANRSEIALYPPIANYHENHILDLSVCPVPALATVTDEAQAIARTIVEQLDVVGILCVEFFLTTDGRILVNEIAPRPHNSGHLTIEACCTSQFEQQLRAICGLPLGSTEPVRAAAMANLLGDLWQSGEPPWPEALADPAVRLHLYGKTLAKVGRKMGHLTVLADSPQEAADRALAVRDRLAGQTTARGAAPLVS
jgi:5-(carboxyamino)imidazole ribonucleotide synthase